MGSWSDMSGAMDAGRARATNMLREFKFGDRFLPIAQTSRHSGELKPAQQVLQWLMGKAVMISVIIRVTVGTSATHSQMHCSSRFRPVSQTQENQCTFSFFTVLV